MWNATMFSFWVGQFICISNAGQCKSKRIASCQVFDKAVITEWLREIAGDLTRVSMMTKYLKHNVTLRRL